MKNKQYPAEAYVLEFKKGNLWKVKKLSKDRLTLLEIIIPIGEPEALKDYNCQVAKTCLN